MRRPAVVVMLASLASLAIVTQAGCKGRFALPADARFVQQIAVASTFACARMKDGSVRCWGANESGQLGDGTLVARPETAKVALDGPAIAVAVGEHHACAIVVGGDVYCWGANDAGQAGGASSPAQLKPTRIDGVRARALALGGHHSCAILEGGAVRCWGADQAGQGTEASKALGATAITASADATCIIDAERRVACWGAVPGRVGTAYGRIEGLADITGVALGSSHGCALRAWGGVACWGKGTEGGAFSDGSLPADVQGLAAPGKAIAVGRAHACASLGDDTVRCWGENGAAQLADGTRTSRASAVQVQGIFEAIQVSAGGDAACAVLGDGSARCWGGLALPKTEGVPVVVPTEVRW